MPSTVGVLRQPLPTSCFVVLLGPLSESPESIWIAADTIDPGPPPPQVVPAVHAGHLPRRTGWLHPPAPRRHRAPRSAEHRHSAGSRSPSRKAVAHVVRHADEPGPLGCAPLTKASVRPNWSPASRRARHACAVLGVAGLGIEVRDGEHLDHALVGGGPVLGRDTDRESGGDVAEAGAAKASWSPKRSPGSAAPPTPAVSWVRFTPGVMVTLLELNSCTAPALLSLPTSSPGMPTASRAAPPTRTVSRLRPNWSPARPCPGRPASPGGSPATRGTPRHRRP